MDLVFQGTSWLNKGLTPNYMAQARSFFEKAMALDPENVEAMVGLARVDATTGAALMTDDWSARFTSAEATLTKALSLAPNHALAHAVLGVVQIFTKRAAQGIAECQQALTLDRNLARAHALIGLAKVFLGRGAETEALVNEAFRLSPRDTMAHRWMAFVGVAKAQLGADAEALVWMRRGLDANRNSSVGHFDLAGALARLGELDKARAEVQAGLALDPSFTIRRYRDATNARSDNPTFLAGRDRAIEGMRMAGVPEG
jgi:tetratricopeptide (TPR) repeat protein